jgi:hypothetical protein
MIEVKGIDYELSGLGTMMSDFGYWLRKATEVREYTEDFHNKLFIRGGVSSRNA